MKRKIFIKMSLKNLSALEINNKEIIDRIKKVYRLKPKDTIYFVGEDLVEGIFLFEDPRRMRFRKIKEITRKTVPLRKIKIFLSFIKKESFELVLKKSAELGVYSITPLISERSPWHTDKIPERWHKIIYSTLEVSEWAFITKLENPIRIKDVPPDSFVLEREGERFDKNFFDEKINLIVGPEGGFSKKELEILKDKGCKFVSLGKVTLKSETAPLVAISLLNFPI